MNAGANEEEKDEEEGVDDLKTIGSTGDARSKRCRQHTRRWNTSKVHPGCLHKTGTRGLVERPVSCLAGAGARLGRIAQSRRDLITEQGFCIADAISE